MHELPHQRYFKAKEGHWEGTFAFSLTHPEKLKSLPWLSQYVFRALDLSNRSLFQPQFSTTLDYGSRSQHQEVIHTTRLSHRNITLFQSTEVITLAEDGLHFTMKGRQRIGPRWGGAISTWQAHGAVASDKDSACYYIPWLGTQLEQQTHMTPQGLEIVQTTPVSQARILLQWQGPLKKKDPAPKG